MRTRLLSTFSASTMIAVTVLAVGVLGACGGPAPAANRPTTSSATPSWLEAPRVPFRTTLPDGTVIALDEAGRVTVDGDLVGTLEEDARIETGDGERLASLLADGRISFDGELTEARVSGAQLIENGVAILEIDQDRTLTLRRPDGADVASVPVIGVTPESRSTVLYVVAVHLLGRSRAGEGEIREVLARDEEDGIERVRVPVEGRPTRGPESALVTIVMIEDFQCPFCSRAASTMEELGRIYGERVRFVFVHNPLPFHDHARDAAIVAEEALAQRGVEGFWAMYEILFANQRALEHDDLVRYATQAGLDAARVRSALDEERHGDRIDADAALAARIGASGTPAFYLNGIEIVGAQPIEVFREAIDREIAVGERLVELGVPPSQIYALRMASASSEPAPRPEPPARRPERRARPDPSAVYRVPVDGAPVRGRADALVTIVVFSDFQCPFCARALPTLEQIEQTYGRDVRIVFRHNPLPFHDHAMPAAEAAAEAFAQRGADAFWQMHDLLFANQDALERADLERYARQLRLDPRRFARALDEHTHRAEIEADQTLARELGASGTPSFFINGRSLRGAQPFDAFRALIDEELARARERVAAGTPRGRVYEALTRDGARAPVLLPDEGGGGEPDADRVFTIAVPAGAPTRGAAAAPVTIQIFSDFQCPFCARVRPTVEQILATYAGRVRLVWRNYPLPFHAHAERAAEAAMEVHAQLGADAFWRFHDILFENQRALEDADLESYAQQIPGLDLPRFRAALADHRHLATIRADMEAVRRAGAEIGTPSFFVNGRLIQGAQPFEAFRAAIDRALAERH